MPGLAAYVLAGAAAGIGKGIVQRAESLAAEALASAEKQDKWDLEEQKHLWRVDELGVKARLKGGGKGGSGGLGGGSATGGSSAPSSGGLGGGSVLSSTRRDGDRLVRRNADGTSTYGRAEDDFPEGGPIEPIGDAAAVADAEFPTYQEPAPTGGDASGLPRKAGANEEVVNRFEADDGSWRAFTKRTNEEVLLKAPTKTPDAAPVEEELTDQITGRDGFIYGRTKTGKVRPYLDADTGKKIRAAAKAGSEDDGPSDAQMKLSEALGDDAPVAVKAQAQAEVDRLMADGKSENEAVFDVISRLDAEPDTPASNSWMPLDEVKAKKGAVKGLKPADDPAVAGTADQRQTYPDAPRAPADRVVGTAYRSPTGALGIWTGTGWKPVNG